MPKRRAIYPAVIVVSARKRAASATFRAATLGRVWSLVAFHFRRDELFGFCYIRLLRLLAVMLHPQPLPHLREQLLSKRFLAQTPASSGSTRNPKLKPRMTRVNMDTRSITAKDRGEIYSCQGWAGHLLNRAIRGSCFWIRIQVNVIAEALQIIGARTLHDQRLVATGEKMLGQLVPPVEARRVGVAGRNLRFAICDLKLSAAWSPAQGFDETLVFRFVLEDGFTRVAPIQGACRAEAHNVSGW